MEVQMASLLLHSVTSMPAGSVTHSVFSSRSLARRKVFLNNDLPMRKASLRTGLLTAGPRDPIVGLWSCATMSSCASMASQETASPCVLEVASHPYPCSQVLRSSETIEGSALVAARLSSEERDAIPLGVPRQSFHQVAIMPVI
eukprot:8381731-Heterocapsa_arctica.AAC.1